MPKLGGMELRSGVRTSLLCVAFQNGEAERFCGGTGDGIPDHSGLRFLGSGEVIGIRESHGQAEFSPCKHPKANITVVGIPVDDNEGHMIAGSECGQRVMEAAGFCGPVELDQEGFYERDIAGVFADQRSHGTVDRIHIHLLKDAVGKEKRLDESDAATGGRDGTERLLEFSWRICVRWIVGGFAESDVGAGGGQSRQGVCNRPSVLVAP